MGGPTPDVNPPPWRAVVGGIGVIAATSVAAWALAQPLNSLSATATRAAADCAAIVTLGLAVVPLLDTGRYRGELSRSAAVPLAVGAAVWLLTELVRLVVVSAQTAALPAGTVGVATYIEFITHTAAGRAGAVSAVAAAVVCGMAVAAPRTTAVTLATAGIAASGLAARTLAGHLAESPLGGVAVAVHALAAGLWCGALVGLLATVAHRGQWARVLPRFSTLALCCVGALVLAGLAGAMVTVGSPGDLITTGYGRLMTAKLLVTAALTALAWRNRSRWLPAARGHRASAGLSRSRSLVELAVMTVALTLAAALAVTG
ncbi:CopD family protein [Mycolicibacterium litorale]|uniref:Copper resistance protein D n=1 Tax=Mycolicibacterium litorale TaxID=758802 RepID=A0AAD1IW80_9MYCO|nr:CopD family protein [Mycolicibacterium litorale]MCV7417703.1 CopD family protein [Mycolicibacterium litorale]TDY06908.1 putative copper resistance protein D [Mycolicibacterium litorale]BBY18933.1 copper resistance protein D [Mycolicibacterium litorale]